MFKIQSKDAEMNKMPFDDKKKSIRLISACKSDIAKRTAAIGG